MIVLKFGGTSVSTKDRILTIGKIVQREQERKSVVVVSAIRGVTDHLLECLSASGRQRQTILSKIKKIHRDLIKEYWGEIVLDIDTYLENCLLDVAKILNKKQRSKAVSDEVVSYGEIISSFIISKALETFGLNAKQVLGTELIVTDDNFGSAEFLPDATSRKTKHALLPLLEKGVVPVVTGFIGAAKNGKTTTLGRGGSDYSAAILGFALNAQEIQIWTDVDGIYTADPRLIPTATRLPSISYREASELAAFGAKVLHPRTIRPAITTGIPVRVLNTLNPESEGTMIVAPNGKKAHRVTAVASKQRTVLVNLYATEMLLSKGFLVRIFAVFAKHNISVDLVSVSEVSVSVTLDNDENLAKATKELGEFTTVMTQNVGMVSMIGDGLVEIPHIMRNIFSLLDSARIPVHMISLGASDINISLIVDSKDVASAVQLLHDNVVVGLRMTERKYL